MRKASQDQERTSAVQMKELVEIKADRITELESELERLRPNEDATMMSPREDLGSAVIGRIAAEIRQAGKEFPRPSTRKCRFGEVGTRRRWVYKLRKGDGFCRVQRSASQS